MGTAWTNDMAVGVAEMDSQHQEWFRQTDRIEAALTGGNLAAEVRGILGFLDNYVRMHFGMEAKLMEQYQYPQKELHLLQHSTFIAEFEAMKRRVQTEDITPALASDVQRRLASWLVQHIARTDRLLGAHVNRARLAKV